METNLAVIGFEGGSNDRIRAIPINWAAAAVLETREDGVWLVNAVTKLRTPNGREEAKKLERKGAITLLPEPVPVEAYEGNYVVLIKTQLWERKPYRIHDILQKPHGLSTWKSFESTGATALIFESYQRVLNWFSMLHVGPWELTPYQDS
jgi:hypothetical protein